MPLAVDESFYRKVRNFDVFGKFAVNLAVGAYSHKLIKGSWIGEAKGESLLLRAVSKKCGTAKIANLNPAPAM